MEPLRMAFLSGTFVVGYGVAGERYAVEMRKRRRRVSSARMTLSEVQPVRRTKSGSGDGEDERMSGEPEVVVGRGIRMEVLEEVNVEKNKQGLMPDSGLEVSGRAALGQIKDEEGKLDPEALVGRGLRIEVLEEEVSAEGAKGGLMRDPREEVSERTGLEKIFNWEFLWPRGLLLFVAAIWGTNFGSVKWLTDVMPASLAAALRFSLATAALAPATLRASSRNVWIDGAIAGVVITLGYFSQALALQMTEANKGAFLCSLAVVIVPFVESFFRDRTKPAKSPSWTPALVAIFGVGLLELGGGSQISWGDMFGLLQALFFGLGFIANERAIKRNPSQALALSGVQLGVVALASIAWAGADWLTGGISDVMSYMTPSAVGIILYTGLITTALTVALENMALEWVTASELAVLLSTEPLWAAAFSQFLLGETMGPGGLAGGACVIFACINSALRSAKEKGE